MGERNKYRPSGFPNKRVASLCCEDRFTFKENPMSNVAGAQAQARKAAFERRQSSDVQDIRDNIQDLGNSVGDMATRNMRALMTLCRTRCARLAAPFNAIRWPPSVLA